MFKVKFLSILLFWLVAMLFFAVLGSSAEDSESEDKVVVIVNKASPIESLSFETLSNIYLGKQQMWKHDQKKIKIFVHDAKTDEAKIFVETFLKTTNSKFSKAWMAKMLAGDAIYPEIVNSSAELLEKVANNSEAIGYIFESEIDDSVKKVPILSTSSKE